MESIPPTKRLFCKCGNYTNKSLSHLLYCFAFSADFGRHKHFLSTISNHVGFHLRNQLALTFSPANWANSLPVTSDESSYFYFFQVKRVPTNTKSNLKYWIMKYHGAPCYRMAHCRRICHEKLQNKIKTGLTSAQIIVLHLPCENIAIGDDVDRSK